MNSEIERRICAFNEMRDIPYHIDLVNKDLDRSCVTKSVLLGERLKMGFGLASRIVCCRFRWNSMPLPAALKARISRSDSWHEYLEVMIPDTETWAALDPTLDSGLKKAGFPIAEWDGLGSTILAVKPIQTFTPEQSRRLVQVRADLSATALRQYYEENADFIDGLNAWVARARQGLETPHA
ncbi:MAG TPA: hypothetical protein VMV79_06835 [Alphaproteobacteria bacterium]|nr:hypothetical protein [Alphaproteobacteria bacterium]